MGQYKAQGQDNIAFSLSFQRCTKGMALLYTILHF